MKCLIAKLFGNLGRVNKDVWRSGQSWKLYPIWFFMWLFGSLKTIINVADSPDDIQDTFEEKFCKLLKINYINFDNLAPNYHFERVYHTLVKCNKPCLVHCERGKDRTFGLIAYYMLHELKLQLKNVIKAITIHGIPDEIWLLWIFGYKPCR